MWSSENRPGSKDVLAKAKYLTKLNRTEKESYFCGCVDGDELLWLKLGDEVYYMPSEMIVMLM